jgi:hypothetical protein
MQRHWAMLTDPMEWGACKAHPIEFDGPAAIRVQYGGAKECSLLCAVEIGASHQGCDFGMAGRLFVRAEGGCKLNASTRERAKTRKTTPWHTS